MLKGHLGAALSTHIGIGKRQAAHLNLLFGVVNIPGYMVLSVPLLLRVETL